MDTKILKLDRNNLDDHILDEAGRVLRDGGLVAFPTETVYGLGADALNEKAAEKTYAAKGRPSDNPLIVHIAQFQDLSEIVEEIPEASVELAERFWPGPLTMIFKKSKKVPYGTTGGLDTVAVRMPDDEIALALIRAGGGYVSAPSANTSGRPSPTEAGHVAEDLNGKIEIILDGGSVEIGVESTIVDMTVVPPMILRPGAVTREMLEEAIGDVSVDKTLISDDSKQVPKAPGMKYRHYAPDADLLIVEGSREETTKAIRQIAYEQIRLGYRVGIIASDETVDEYTVGNIKNAGSREHEKSVAQNLYRILREFDEEGVDYIYSESFPVEGIGTAVMNRLGKAAGHHVIQAETITRLQKYRTIVFVSDSGNCRAPIAAALLKKQPLFQEYTILARGMVVLFPEPLNAQAEETLKKHGIELEGFDTRPFSEELVQEDTLVLTMTAVQREKLRSEYPSLVHVHTLCEYVCQGDEFPSVYGQTLEQYGEMYDQIQDRVIKLAKKLNEEAKG